MAQPSLALPDQVRSDHATPISLGTDVQVSVVVLYTRSTPITVQADNNLLSMFKNLVIVVLLIQ